MEPENQFNTQPGSAPASVPAAAPPAKTQPMSMSNLTSGMRPEGGEIAEISDRHGPNGSTALLWLCAILAITATVWLWFLDRSAAQNVVDKTSQRDATIAEISMPTYRDVEAKATAFQAAVSQLSTVQKSRYKMSEFLPLLYAKINKNVVVKNVAVDTDGKLSLGGTTDSYKSAALQVATLQGWKVNDLNVLSNVQLVSESESITSGVVVTFSISASINKTVSLTTVSASANTTSNATTGGN